MSDWESEMDKAGIGDTGQDDVLFTPRSPLVRSGPGEDGARRIREIATRAQAFASLVSLAERSSVLDVNLGQIAGRNWCATINFVSGDILDAVADSPEAAVKAVEEKMQEREDIQSGLMEDT